MGRLNGRCWPTSASIERERMANYITRLEEERGKIEAFKRELPLCMQLVKDVIEASRKQLADSQSHIEEEEAKTHGRGVGEESILLNKASIQTDECMKKSAQLLNPDPHNRKDGMPLCGEESPKQPLSSNRQLFWDAKDRVGGAFHPFSISPLPLGSRTSLAGDGSKLATTTQVQDKEASNAQKKSRRCWSAELHRRFVNALQQLGGSQVATPKQIRELMKVDGLTNDEVKSHLQKYRLHTRRPTPPQNSTVEAPHLVVVGGIWVPPHYSPPPTAASPCHPIPPDYYSHLQLHHSIRRTPLHSHSSSYGPLHFQSSGGGATETKSGREESVGDDRNSDSSSWRADDCTRVRGLSLKKTTSQFFG